MSGGLDGPGPHERSQPSGRRTRTGVRIEAADSDFDCCRAVLSAVVKSEPGVLAEVTGLAVQRQIVIERLVAEPMDDGVHSQITFTIKQSHPGVEQAIRHLENLRPVMVVEEHDLDTAKQLTSSVIES